MLEKREVKIELLIHPQTRREWPYYKGKKALSASSLTKVLREVEYEKIPEYILIRAAKRGNLFHEILQNFFSTGSYPIFVDKENEESLSKEEKKIKKTINFIKSNKFIISQKYVEKEKLYYVFYKENLIASIIDLCFENICIELKSNNKSNKNSLLTLLIFEIQLLIQFLCTQKDIYILWSSDKEIVFKKFLISENSLKILDMLIELVNREKFYPISVQKAIVKQIISNYWEPTNSLAN